MAQIDPTSAVLYQAIARLRRLLLENPGLTIEVLREALGLVLDASEELLQASDEVQRTLVKIAGMMGAGEGPR